MNAIEELESIATPAWLRVLPYVAVVLLIAGAAYGFYHHGYGVAELKYKAIIAKADKAHADEIISLQLHVAAVEHKAADDMAAIDAQHQKEQVDEKSKTDVVIAGLLDGTVRLRKRLAAISKPAQLLPCPATGTCSSDDAQSVGLQQADAELLVRLAAEADSIADQLRACQAVVRADRAVKINSN